MTEAQAQAIALAATAASSAIEQLRAALAAAMRPATLTAEDSPMAPCHPPISIIEDDPRRWPGVDTSWGDCRPADALPVATDATGEAVDPRLSPSERAAGYVRPLRLSVQHTDRACRGTYQLPLPAAKLLATDPKRYTVLLCPLCGKADEAANYRWKTGEAVGT